MDIVIKNHSSEVHFVTIIKLFEVFKLKFVNSVKSFVPSAGVLGQHSSYSLIFQFDFVLMEPPFSL